MNITSGILLSHFALTLARHRLRTQQSCGIPNRWTFPHCRSISHPKCSRGEAEKKQKRRRMIMNERSEARNQQKLATTCENRYKCTCGLAFTSFEGFKGPDSEPLQKNNPPPKPRACVQSYFATLLVVPRDPGYIVMSGRHVHGQNVCKWMEKPPQSKAADKPRGWRDDAVAKKLKKKTCKKSQKAAPTIEIPGTQLQIIAYLLRLHRGVFLIKNLSFFLNSGANGLVIRI